MATDSSNSNAFGIAEPSGESRSDAFARVLVEAEAAARGVDPDILEYLLAADTDDDSDERDDSPIDSSGKRLPTEVIQALSDRVNQGSFADLDPIGYAQVQQIYDAIISRAPEHKVQPSLERVEMAMELLGDPQNQYRVAHITGTNGKTSTTRMIEALATTQGLRTGRFTSPHLIEPNERIAIAGEPLSHAGFKRAYEDIAPIVDLVDSRNAQRMSFFEVLTVMAYAAFADAPVDLAVVEVGMGGRWDATNVVTPEVAVIMPISRDHTNWLGSSIVEIATEKSGIIKDGGIVIVGPQSEEAMAVIRDSAATKGAIVRAFGEDFKVVERKLAVGGQVISVQTPVGIYSDIYLPLFGEHQAVNAACAIAAYEVLLGGEAIPAPVLESAFADVTSPGRMQIVRKSPMLIVDAAHNPAGAAVLAKTLREDMTYSRYVGIFSSMQDKEHEAILAELEPVLDEIVVVPMGTERAATLEELQEVAISVFGADRTHCAQRLIDAIDQATTLAEIDIDDPMTSSATIAFGSVVLAGQVMRVAGHAGNISK